LTIASTGISNRIVCSHGPLMTISISPLSCAEGLIVMYLVLSWNRPRKSTKSLLMKRRPRRYASSCSLKRSVHRKCDLLADLVDVRRQVDARVAALEAVLDLRVNPVGR
jgi:hypothetical protein